MRSHPYSPTALPLDALLVLLLSLPYFLQFRDSVLMLVVPLVVAYLLVSGLLRATPLGYLLRFALIALMVALTTLTPMLADIGFRRATEGTTNAFITSGSMHDGALQTEEAVRLFLEGKNPYAADYADTLVAQYPMDVVAVNPALDHYVYLPFTVLGSVPFYWVFNATLGWYDQRLVYGLGFLAVLALVPSQARDRENRLLLWIVLGLNPLLTGRLHVGVTSGANDYLILALVMLTVALLRSGRRSLSAIPLALASGIKPSAWFFLPLYLVLLWGRGPRSGTIPAVRKAATLYGGVLAAIVVPFLLWDAGAFTEDVLQYASGGSASAYPIRGLGLSALLLLSGLIDSPTAHFPFWILELSLGATLLVVLLRQQLRHNTIRQAWLGYSLLLGLTALVSRFLNPNYLGYILAALALGLWSDPDPTPVERRAATRSEDEV